MTSTTPSGAGRGSRLSVVILGADALLAALPATPTQLANACFLAGYDDVVPASWGDELLAVGCLDQLAARDEGPAIACICPLVREQLRGAHELEPATIRLVSPPVAAALYVRATAGDAEPHITYVGDCPGAGHPAIDIHLAPAQFLALLAERGIAPGAQPPVASDRSQRDRRRHYSLPGGVPAEEWLGSEGIARTLVDLGALPAADAGVERTLVDLAPRLGCVCSGALAGGAAERARGAVIALEPPRSSEEIVNHAVAVPITDDAPSRRGGRAGSGVGGDVPWEEFVAALAGVWSGGAPVPVPAVPLPTTTRPPLNRPHVPKRLGVEGRVLPRAYQVPNARSGIGGGVRARAARRAERRPVAPAASLDAMPRPAETAARAVLPSAGRPTGPTATSSRVTAARVARTALATTDRWLLLGMALAASVIVAVLTSVMTVHGLRGAAPALTAATPAPRAETVYVAAARIAPSSGGHAAPAAEPHASPVDTVAAESAATGALPNDRPRTPRVVAEHRLAVPRPHPQPLAVREHVAAAHRPAADPNAGAPAAALPASTTTVSATPARPAPAPSTPVPAPASTAASGAPPAAAAAARDTSAQSNAEVLRELRAIHAEIEERKRHVDSLSHALDSLDKVQPPR